MSPAATFILVVAILAVVVGWWLHRRGIDKKLQAQLEADYQAARDRVAGYEDRVKADAAKVKDLVKGAQK